MTKQELEEQSEKIVKDTFKEGDSWQYVSYVDGLADVVLDGNFDLRELVEQFVNLSEKAIAEERKRIVEIIAETQKTTRLEQFTVDTILSLINKDN